MVPKLFLRSGCNPVIEEFSFHQRQRGKRRASRKRKLPYPSGLLQAFLITIFAAITMSIHISNTIENIIPVTDPIFAGIPISNRSYFHVRNQYTLTKEVREPMAVVKLPDDFQGIYHPKTTNDFKELSSRLLDEVMGEFTRTSQYGVVSICINMDLCELSRSNHELYAITHGYDYLTLSRDVSGVPPKMLKFLLLVWAMRQGYEWLLMLDADALFTNQSITIPSLLQDFDVGSETSLIATRGGRWRQLNPLNNGIFLIKNNDWSVRHLFEIFTTKWAFTRFLGRSLVDQPVQMSILMAKKELEWPPVSEEERGKHVMIVPKRRLNSFRRSVGFDAADIEEGGTWQTGDFIAHFASGSKYSLMVDLMEQERLPGVPQVEQRFPFNLPTTGDETEAGTCFCSDGTVNCIPRYHVIGVHKTGTKEILQYMSGHPGLASSPFVEDQTRWLTDSMAPADKTTCSAKSNENPRLPSYIRKGGRKIFTCSHKDYTLLQGMFSTDDTTCEHGMLPFSGFLRPMSDEMVIWDKTFDRVRGVPLPKLFSLWQPTAKMIITVRNPIDVVYSDYHRFGGFKEEVEKGPEHFGYFIKNLSKLWSERRCTPENYLRCLPSEVVTAGSWLSRVMYSRYLPHWLDRFPCSQVYLFDASVDPKLEVSRLFHFMGVPDETVAANVTAATYTLQENDAPTSQDYSSTRGRRRMDYDPMLMETRVFLSEFFAPYNKELCNIMERYSCLKVPVFLNGCN